MGKRQALAEFHRGSILAAAGRLFVRHGVNGTTMDDIAREAEYSKATLYVYFQSKEEIVGAILLNGLGMLKKRICQAVRSHEDWEEAYHAICKAILDFYTENPAAYEAVMDGGSGGVENTKSDQDIRRAVNELCRELAAFLAPALPQEEDPMEAVLFFWAAAAGMIRMVSNNSAFLERQSKKSREDFLQEGFRLLRRGLSGK